jgi:SNF2 family DNA or RNA helicase
MVVDMERCREVAQYFVDGGRVVPGMVVGADGRMRSQWWPLPTAGDRELLASLLVDDSAEAHREVAETLAEEVDREVRDRLISTATTVVGRRPGRRTVPQAWALSLATDDPWLPASHDEEKVAAFADEVERWVCSGAAVAGNAQLCVRVLEPSEPDEAWRIDLLARDVDEPSLMVPLDEVWDGTAPFAPGALEELLGGLGRLVRLAPEVAPVLDAAVPTGIELDDRTVLGLVRDRTADLEESGIAVLLPSWWTRGRRLGLRAKTSKSVDDGAVTEAGFSLEQMVEFTWEAALGARRLTKADLRTLEAAASAKRALVRVRGEWVQVDPGEIEAILRNVGAHGEATGAELLRAGLGIDTIAAPEDVAVVGVVAAGALGELLDEALHSTVHPIPTPDGFVGQLREYQERGVGWLTFLGRLGLGACLADDMGLGKTAQLIATVLADRVDGPTLVVCPVSVLGNWANELERFAPELSVLIHHGPDRSRDGELAEMVAAHDVVLTTYALVARDVEQLAEITFARLVLDEAQQVKNHGTAQARAVARLRAGRRIALTGTPVENRLSDLWSLMHVLNPELLGSMGSFKERFARPIERDHDPDATALLRRITTPFVLRRLKTDRSIIDDLPDKIEQTERCPLTREQATLYQAVVDDLLEVAEGAEGIERRGLVLAGVTKLKQVCNHPAHLLGDGSPLPHRSGKLTRVEELLDEILAAGDKVLCFTQYAKWGELLRAHLTRRYGIEPLWLHGGVTRRGRDEVVARFAEPDGPPIFLLSLKAGGTGLNLTPAAHVIHLDRWWNPAVEDQATDRAYRIGQHRTVHVHKLVSSGTIEERIDTMITNKRALAERVVGAGDQWLTELSTEELRDVIELRASEFDR